MKTTEERIVVDWKKSILRHLVNVQMRKNPKPFIDPTVDQTAHHEGCDYQYHKDEFPGEGFKSFGGKYDI